MDLLGLRQTDRLSKAVLILHSPATSWSPAASSPRITRTLRHREDPEDGRDETPALVPNPLYGVSELLPSSCAHPTVLRGRTGCAHGALGDPGFVVVTSRGDRSDQRAV